MPLDPAPPDALALLREIRDELLALSEIRDELLALRADLRPPPRTLGRRDAERIALLVPAILALVGPGVAFSVRELIAFARSNDDDATELRGAIKAAVGFDAGSARRLGKLFSRCRGGRAGDVRLDVAGDDRSGLIWTLIEGKVVMERVSAAQITTAVRTAGSFRA